MSENAHQQSPKENASVSQDHEGIQQHTGSFLSPPPFQLTASNVQPSSTSAAQLTVDTSAPVQRKTPDMMDGHDSSNTYTDQSGPISVDSAGNTGEAGFSPDDVHQGFVGDCYFLAALSSVAQQNPGILNDAISGPDGEGWYTVRIYTYQGGFIGIGSSLQEKNIKVWPSFPTQDSGGGNTYARGGDTDSAGNEELWVKLFEKAYAQEHGGYDDIDGGYAENALQALTGQEFSRHGTQGGLFSSGPSESEIATAITGALDEDHEVTASTMSQDDIEDLSTAQVNFANNNGIIGRHAYSVISATDSNITLRNPHGALSGSGTPGGGGSVSATFTITYAQFKTYFDDYTTRD